MKLITLTGTDGNILLLNVEAIAYFRPGPTGETCVHTTAGEVKVAQAVNDVLLAINDALK